MDSRQLLEAVCGQSNPIEQLSAHVIYDQAQQERIAYPGTSGRRHDNSMPPQSFRMEDLMQEIRSIESPNDSVPHTSSETTWFNEFSAQMTQGNLNDAYEPFPNEFYANRQSNDFGYHFERPRTYYVLPGPQQQFQSQYVTQMMTQEELKLQREIEESQKEFLEASVEIESECQEEIVDSSQEESEDLTSTSKPLICWDGLCLDDDRRVTDYQLDKPHLFIHFERAYVDKYMNIKVPDVNEYVEISLPNRLMDLKPYQYRENNPMLGNSNALEVGNNAYNGGKFDLAIICFEGAVQQDPNNLVHLSKLCKALLKNNELQEGLYIASQILKLAPKNLWAHNYIVDVYVKTMSSYQVCQYTLNWLRFNESYADIVLPNFKMEDKTTTELDEDTLNEVKKMLIKAAQRNPSDPDVQLFLAKLCYISGDNEKVSDCLEVITKGNHERFDLRESKFKLGLSFFYGDQPEKAIRVWHEVAAMDSKIYHIYRKIGFAYMYLGNYSEAAHYLTLSLREKYPNIRDMKFGKDFARLSLCLELWHRSNCRGNRVGLFDVTFKEFIKSYCGAHLS